MPGRPRVATQNPIETEGTYPLPEAQVDRFMMKVWVDYPTEEDEFVIVERVTRLLADAGAVATTGGGWCAAARMPPRLRRASLMQYGSPLGATRDPEKLGIKNLGEVPDATARTRALPPPDRRRACLAFLRGRDYALPRTHRPGAGTCSAIACALL